MSGIIILAATILVAAGITSLIRDINRRLDSMFEEDIDVVEDTTHPDPTAMNDEQWADDLWSWRSDDSAGAEWTESM